jgi:hypothetical protein
MFHFKVFVVFFKKCLFLGSENQSVTNIMIIKGEKTCNCQNQAAGFGMTGVSGGMARPVPLASGRGSPIFSVYHGRVRLDIGRDRLQNCDSRFFSSSMQSVTSHLAVHEFNMYALIF